VFSAVALGHFLNPFSQEKHQLFDPNDSLI